MASNQLHRSQDLRLLGCMRITAVVACRESLLAEEQPKLNGLKRYDARFFGDCFASEEHAEFES